MLKKALTVTVKSRMKPKVLKSIWSVLKHWYQFQKKAYQLKAWKFKYLFHDFQLIGLILLLLNVDKANEIHKYYSKHHIENIKDIYDLDQMVIDWEVKYGGARKKLREYPKKRHLFLPILKKFDL